MPLDSQSVPYEEMSVAALAHQPLVAPEPREGKDWEIIYQRLEARLQSMAMTRMAWWRHWGEVARLTLPSRYRWLVTPNDFSRGGFINDAIVDSTAALALNVCAPM